MGEIWTDSEDEEWGADSLQLINGSLEAEDNDSITARVLQQQQQLQKEAEEEAITKRDPCFKQMMVWQLPKEISSHNKPLENN